LASTGIVHLVFKKEQSGVRSQSFLIGPGN
jgi:hypothetical protein